MVKWLGLGAFTAVGPDSIPGWGTKILQATQCSQTNKQTKQNKTHHNYLHAILTYWALTENICTKHLAKKEI